MIIDYSLFIIIKKKMTTKKKENEKMAKTNTNTTETKSSVTILEDKNSIIVRGILSQNVDKAGWKGKGGVKRNLSIKMVNPLTDEERSLLAKMCKTTVDDKYCPHAIKEEKEFFTVKSMFKIPIRIYDTSVSISELEDSGIDTDDPDINDIGLGSEVKLLCKCKENAIYPMSMGVNKLKIFNPFELLE